MTTRLLLARLTSTALQLTPTGAQSAPANGASGPVPNLPPLPGGNDCPDAKQPNCPGGPKVTPRSELAVYVFGEAGCKEDGAEIAATAYGPAPSFLPQFL